ncbi:hypothetical protein Tel_08195 [Candidatus Tenderia electrophaga]|jgi:hypothetical protein|uniref:DUF211 domain-containing protein n=1 Tax=Candidatus Tenderia electrophaga TaxID=1748243 RepID=A0A0S2TDD8_9GAMM|nr:hypothetical protein Tel_08195 [Candidatus Tenderia electrophaga]
MAIVTRVVLDVLKPHRPNALEFASQLADLDPGYQVNLVVQEVDDKTQSLILSISGAKLDFDEISRNITTMGGSVHSIDEVDVRGGGAEAAP